MRPDHLAERKACVRLGAQGRVDAIRAANHKGHVAAPFVAPWARSFTLSALCLFMIVMTLAVIALRRALAARGVETGWHALKREEAQFPFGVPIACAVAAALWLAARVAGG